MLNRRCAVTHVDAKLLRGLGGQGPPHGLSLEDHLLVGIDGVLCVIRVVPGLVATCLVGRFGCQRFFALATDDGAANTQRD